MKLSIVVPAFNEEKLLAKTLEAIKSAAAVLAYRGWEWELIVCDNNSTDRTAEIARAAGAKVVFEPVNQIGRARNCGAAAATGDWLVFVDADSLPSAPQFEALLAAIQTGKPIAGGCTVRLDKPSLIGSLGTGLWNCISRWKKWAAGSFVFCERAAFNAIGGFSTELFASEELDLSMRLQALGKRQGRKMVILNVPMTTSGRKFGLYSNREHLRFFLRFLRRPGKVLRSREACSTWYDGRR